MAVLPAYWVGGPLAVVGSAVATGICWLPTVATFGFQRWSWQKGGNWRVGSILGGMLVRVVVVFGAGVALSTWRPELDLSHFLIWLMWFYLASLTVEVYLLARSGSAIWPPHR
jgi:hypothetical protein